jgi:hypothetical protein
VVDRHQGAIACLGESSAGLRQRPERFPEPGIGDTAHALAVDTECPLDDGGAETVLMLDPDQRDHSHLILAYAVCQARSGEPHRLSYNRQQLRRDAGLLASLLETDAGERRPPLVRGSIDEGK